MSWREVKRQQTLCVWQVLPGWPVHPEASGAGDNLWSGMTLHRAQKSQDSLESTWHLRNVPNIWKTWWALYPERMYLCLCAWESSNQLPPLAFQAAEETRKLRSAWAALICMTLQLCSQLTLPWPSNSFSLLVFRARWPATGLHNRTICLVSSWVILTTKGVTYNSCLFPRWLSVEHKDRLYIMFEEGECAEEHTCQGAAEMK